MNLAVTPIQQILQTHWHQSTSTIADFVRQDPDVQKLEEMDIEIADHSYKLICIEKVSEETENGLCFNVKLKIKSSLPLRLGNNYAWTPVIRVYAHSYDISSLEQIFKEALLYESYLWEYWGIPETPEDIDVFNAHSLLWKTYIDEDAKLERKKRLENLRKFHKNYQRVKILIDKLKELPSPSSPSKDQNHLDYLVNNIYKRSSPQLEGFDDLLAFLRMHITAYLNIWKSEYFNVLPSAYPRLASQKDNIQVKGNAMLTWENNIPVSNDEHVHFIAHEDSQNKIFFWSVNGEWVETRKSKRKMRKKRAWNKDKEVPPWYALTHEWGYSDRTYYIEWVPDMRYPYNMTINSIKFLHRVFMLLSESYKFEHDSSSYPYSMRYTISPLENKKVSQDTYRIYFSGYMETDKVSGLLVPHIWFSVIPVSAIDNFPEKHVRIKHDILRALQTYHNSL